MYLGGLSEISSGLRLLIGALAREAQAFFLKSPVKWGILVLFFVRDFHPYRTINRQRSRIHLARKHRKIANQHADFHWKFARPYRQI